LSVWVGELAGESALASSACDVTTHATLASTVLPTVPPAASIFFAHAPRPPSSLPTSISVTPDRNGGGASSSSAAAAFPVAADAAAGSTRSPRWCGDAGLQLAGSSVRASAGSCTAVLSRAAVRDAYVHRDHALRVP